MLCQPICDLCRCRAHVAEMRFDVYCPLIPERQAVVIGDVERVVGQVFGPV